MTGEKPTAPNNGTDLTMVVLDLHRIVMSCAAGRPWAADHDATVAVRGAVARGLPAKEGSALSTSTFGWLDHDEGERRRMMDVINLFREKGTLDELGIGTIRDTFAERFFPGTSTVQTRARYFLFIPWMYGLLERERVPSNRADRHARELQWRLVQSLRSGGEGSNAGLIGIEAGENVQRLPSTIYWQGLRRWGIRLFEGSTDRYHASLDGHYRQERTAKSSEGGELLDTAHRHWHGSLPPPPTDLLDKTVFTLCPDEAEFLSERIRRSSPESLLAACLPPLGLARSSCERALGTWGTGTAPD